MPKMSKTVSATYQGPIPTGQDTADHGETLALLRELRATLHTIIAQGMLTQAFLSDATRARACLHCLLLYVEELRTQQHNGAPADLALGLTRVAVDLCQLLEYFDTKHREETADV